MNLESSIVTNDGLREALFLGLELLEPLMDLPLRVVLLSGELHEPHLDIGQLIEDVHEQLDLVSSSLAANELNVFLGAEQAPQQHVLEVHLLCVQELTADVKARQAEAPDLKGNRKLEKTKF